MPIPSPLYLYRIIHIDNLAYIVENKEITCPSHEKANPDYIGIGDDTLIAHRKERPISLHPFGTFNDYVAFYFGRRSPMLYNIKNGYQGVTRRSQNDIIYLITSLEKVKEIRIHYVYFDGHGYHHLSQIFNTEEGLQNIDWDVVNAGKWSDSEDDPDRKRRKQAEFLLFESLPFDAVIGIATFSAISKAKVDEIVGAEHTELISVVRTEWFY